MKSSSTTGPEGVNFPVMQALKAQVKNGRLVLDEPTDLPEGEVVYLQLIDGIVPVVEDEIPLGLVVRGFHAGSVREGPQGLAVVEDVGAGPADPARAEADAAIEEPLDALPVVRGELCRSRAIRGSNRALTP